jgi:hypothetical protein
MSRVLMIDRNVHLDEHGISMDLVSRLRQMRERVLRLRSLEIILQW